jgi:hypothetical protein
MNILKPHHPGCIKSGPWGKFHTDKFHHSDELVFNFCMHQPNGKAGLSSGSIKLKFSQTCHRRRRDANLVTISLQFFSKFTAPHL